MKHLFIAGAVAMAFVGLVFTSQNTSQEQVKVGGLFGQTGFVSFAGEASRNGFTMAIEDADLDPEDFVIEDSGSGLKLTVTAVQKLVSVDKVDVIIGPEWAEFSEVVIPVADQSKTLIISPWMTGEGEQLESEFYLSATPTERAQVRAVLQHLIDSGVTKIALLYSDNAYATGLRSIITDELSRNFISLNVVYESKSAQDTVDYRTELTKIRSSEAQATYSIMATGVSAQAFIKQAQELGVANVYMPFSAVSQLNVADVAAGSADGVTYAVTKEYDRSAEFATKYKARFGTEPSAISAATTYDMTTLVLAAIKGGAKDAKDVHEYLMSVKGHRGYSGVIEFGADGHVVPGVVELRQVTATGSEVVH